MRNRPQFERKDCEMSVSDKIKNRGAHGDSSFMLGGVQSSSENPPDLSVGSVNASKEKIQQDTEKMGK